MSITVGEETSITIQKPTICSEGSFDVVITINGESEVPWMYYEEQNDELQISIGIEDYVITEEHIGIYSIQIAHGNADTKLNQYIALEIKGTVSNNYEVIENTCDENKDYQFYIGTSDDNVLMSDVTQDGLQLICGDSKGNNGWLDGLNHVFFQLYTDFDYLVFHKSIKASNDVDNIIHCQFDSSNNIWLALKSKDDDQDFKIAILQFDVLGNYLKGKKFSLTDELIDLKSLNIVGETLFVIGQDSSDFYPVTTYFKFNLANLDIIDIRQIYIPYQNGQTGRLLNYNGDQNISKQQRNLLNYDTGLFEHIKHYIDIPNMNVYAIGKVDDIAPALFSYSLETFEINWEMYQVDETNDHTFNMEKQLTSDIQVHNNLLYTCIITSRGNNDIIYEEATISKRGKEDPDPNKNYIESTHISSNIVSLTNDDSLISCQIAFSGNRILISLIAIQNEAFKYNIYNQNLSFENPLNALSVKVLYSTNNMMQIPHRIQLTNIQGVFNMYTRWMSIDGSNKESLTRMKFIMNSQSQELEWTESQCEFLQDIKGSESFGTDQDTFIEMWKDKSMLRFTQLPINQYDNSFKTPKYLKQKTFTASTVKDIRGSYVKDDDICRSLHDIGIKTQASKYEYVDDDAIQYTGAFLEFDVNVYQHCQGLIVETDYEVVDEDFTDPSHYSYNKNTNKIKFFPEENPTDFKNYVFTQTAKYVDNDQDDLINQIPVVTQVYTVSVTQNNQPLLETSDDLILSKYSFQLSKTWTFKVCNDDDSPLEIVIEVTDADNNLVEPQPNWLTVSQIGEDKKFTVTVSGHEQPSADTTYSIKVIATDSVHDKNISTATQTIVITLTKNRIPRFILGDEALDLAYVKPGSYHEVIILKDSFIDYDLEDGTNDDFEVQCTSQFGISWLEVVDNPEQDSQQFIVKINTPETDINDGDTYEITCVATDYLDGYALDPITFKFKATVSTINETPSWTPYEFSKDILVDYEYFFSDINSCSDGDGDLTIAYKYYIDFDTEITIQSEGVDHPFYIKQDAEHTTPTLYFNNDKDSKAGNYFIRVTCTDNQPNHQPMQSFYKFNFKPNSDPASSLSSQLTITSFFKVTTLTINNVLSLFTESDPAHVNSLKYYLSTNNTGITPKPSLITYQTGTYATKSASNSVEFTFTAQKTDVGDVTYYLWAEDGRGSLAWRSLQLTIEGCHQTCNDCNGPAENQCIECFDNEDYQEDIIDAFNKKCTIQCGTGRYANSLISCDDCGEFCGSCTGPSDTLDSNNCGQCKETAFENDGVCVEECPSPKTYEVEDHICKAAVASEFEDIVSARSVRVGDTIDITFKVKNPQPLITVAQSYKIFSGVGPSIDRNTDISVDIQWITFTDEDGNGEYTLGSTTVPDVKTPGQDDVYTIEITFENSASITKTFEIELVHIANDAPSQKDDTSLTLPPQIVGTSVSFKILKSWFEDIENDLFEITSCTSDVEELEFTPSSDDIQVTGDLPKDNSFASLDNHTIDCILTDQYNRSDTVTFTMPVAENEVPSVAKQPSTVDVEYGTTYTLNVYEVFEDPEDDDLVFTVIVGSITITNNSDSMYKYYPLTKIFTITYNDFTKHGDKTILIQVTDGITNTDNSDRTQNTEFVVTLPPNNKPTIRNAGSKILPSQIVNKEFEDVYILLDYFEDVEDDILTLDCDFVDQLENISISKISDDFIIEGITDPLNGLAGSYEILCTIEDDYGSNDYTFTLTIEKNQAPIEVNKPDDVVARFGDTVPIDLTGTCTDPEDDTITYHVCIDGEEVSGSGDSGFSFDPLTNVLTFAYSDLEGFGTFDITVVCMDPITDREANTEVIFSIEAIENLRPNIKDGVSQTLATQVVGVQFSLSIEHDWFEDSDNDEFTIQSCEVKKVFISSWFNIEFDDPDMIIGGKTPKSNANVGSYEIECTVEDENNLSNDISFFIPIIANTPPEVVNTPTTKNVVYENSYTVDFSDVCTDVNNDELTYKVFVDGVPIIDDTYEVYQYYPETSIFVFNYNDFNYQGEKDITVTCSDGIVNNKDSVTYQITTELNNVPTIISEEYKTLPPQTVNVPINTKITLGFFEDVEIDIMTLACQVTTQNVNFLTLSEDQYGDYQITGQTPANNQWAIDIKITCQISDDYGQSEVEFTLPILPNQAPVFTRIQEDVIMSLGESQTLSFNGLCTDPEGEEISYILYFENAQIDDTYENSHYDYNAAANTFTFSYPSVDKSGEYSAKIECKDTTQNIESKYFKISAQPNAAPNIISSDSLTLPDQIVGRPVSVNIQKNWFIDKEGDPFTLSCTFTPGQDTAWFSIDSQVNGNTLISGISPLQNMYATTISIDCRVVGPGNNGRDYKFTMAHKQNEAPAFANKPPNDSLTIGNIFSLVVTGMCTDPEGDNLYYSIKFDGELIEETGHYSAKFVQATNTFTYNYQSFINAGSFRVDVICTDLIDNREIKEEFMLSLLPNQRPSLIEGKSTTLSVQTIGKPISATVVFSDFTDPENDVLTLSCTHNIVSGININYSTDQNKDVKLTGTTQLTNSLAMDLTIICTIADAYNSVPINFELPIHPNKAPYIVNYPKDANLAVGEYDERSFNGICADDEDDQLTYKMYYNGFEITDSYENVHIDYVQATNTFKYSYNNVFQSGDKVVKINCFDGIENNYAETSYIISARANHAPYLIDANNKVLSQQKVGKDFQQITIYKSWFEDIEGDNFTISCTITTASSQYLFISPSNDDYIISGYVPKFSSAAGTEKIVCVTDDNNSQKSIEFTFTILPNTVPTIANPLQNVEYKFPDIYPQSFLGVCEDVDGDQLTYSMKVDGVDISASVGKFNFNSTSALFKFTYDNIASKGVYTVTVLCSDGIDSGRTVPTTYQFTALNNVAPKLKAGISTTLTPQIVGRPIDISILKSWFEDVDGDDFSIVCVINTASASTWLNATSQDVNFQIAGTSPKSNDYVGPYLVKCTAKDTNQFSFDQIFLMQINKNQPPSKPTIPPQTVYSTQNYAYVLTDGFIDPEGDTLTCSVKVNNNAVSPSYLTDFTYNAGTYTFKFDYQTEDNEGSYAVSLACTDGIDSNRQIDTVLTITAIANAPPTINKQIAPINIDIFEEGYYLGELSTFFTDPEGHPMTYDLKAQGGGPLPDFITYYEDGGMEIYFAEQFPGSQTYNFDLIATDNAGQKATINFSIIVQGCSDRCSTCSGTAANECSSCSDPYFLNIKTCDTECPDYTWEDDENNLCVECHDFCELCTGPDHYSQCQTCSEDYFKHENGCLDRCPEGFYPDTNTYTCLPIEPTNTQSYLDCQAFVTEMKSNGFVTESWVMPFDEMTGEEVTCPSAYMCHGVFNDPPVPCTWTRKFAMQCTRGVNGIASLRVATNSMPDHCVDTTAHFPEETLIDFEVSFNRQDKFGNITFKGIDDANKYRCANSWLQEFNMLHDYNYIGYGENSNVRDLIVGVAFNGVPIMSGFSEFGFDPFYPKRFGTNTNVRAVPIDDCLGYSGATGFYHYYSITPCILPSAYKTNNIRGELCSKTMTCLSDIVRYVGNQYPKPADFKVIQKVGIARDGHFIIGPYNTNGKLWQPCEVDVCNGVMIQGKYYYATTLFHPYTVGCFGKGSKNIYQQQCSTRALVCSDLTSSDGDGGAGSSAIYTLIPSLLQLGIVTILTLFISFM